MPLPCAVLHGHVAHVVAVVLEQHVQAELHQYSAERSAAVVGTLQALQAAAAARREQEQGRVLRERGNAAQVQGVAAGSDAITTQELARLLEVRERQARNVGRDQALGVKVGDTWAWSRAATLAHREQRRSA